jgi:hypothetical protein
MKQQLPLAIVGSGGASFHAIKAGSQNRRSCPDR